MPYSNRGYDVSVAWGFVGRSWFCPRICARINKDLEDRELGVSVRMKKRPYLEASR